MSQHTNINEVLWCYRDDPASEMQKITIATKIMTYLVISLSDKIITIWIWLFNFFIYSLLCILTLAILGLKLSKGTFKEYGFTMEMCCHSDIFFYVLHVSDISHRAFEDVVSVSRDEASLSSPEVLRRLECSEDRIPERLHTSVLVSRLSEISALNSTDLDLPHVKASPRVVMEPPHSRTITPDPATQSSHSPGSVSMSDNFSMLDSLDTDKVCDLQHFNTSLHAPFWVICWEVFCFFSLDVVKMFKNNLFQGAWVGRTWPNSTSISYWLQLLLVSTRMGQWWIWQQWVFPHEV